MNSSLLGVPCLLPISVLVLATDAEHAKAEEFIMFDLFGEYLEQPKEKTPKEKYQNYIASAKWKRLRVRKIESVGGVCERCGISKFSVKLEVHHLHYRTLEKESLDDLQVLCHACHEYADAERQTIEELEKKARQQSSSLYIGFIEWVKRGNSDNLTSHEMMMAKEKFLTMLFDTQGKSYALDLRVLGFHDSEPNWRPKSPIIIWRTL